MVGGGTSGGGAGGGPSGGTNVAATDSSERPPLANRVGGRAESVVLRAHPFIRRRSWGRLPCTSSRTSTRALPRGTSDALNRRSSDSKRRARSWGGCWTSGAARARTRSTLRVVATLLRGSTSRRPRSRKRERKRRRGDRPSYFGSRARSNSVPWANSSTRSPTAGSSIHFSTSIGRSTLPAWRQR